MEQFPPPQKALQPRVLSQEQVRQGEWLKVHLFNSLRIGHTVGHTWCCENVRSWSKCLGGGVGVGTRRGLKALWCVAVAMAHRTANVSCLQKARNRRSLRRRALDAPPSASTQATAMVARLGLSNGSNESTPQQDACQSTDDDDDDDDDDGDDQTSSTRRLSENARTTN